MHNQALEYYIMGVCMIRFVVAFCFVVVGASAGYAQDATVKGDMEYGQYLSAECVTCHSATGNDKGIPPINGWDAESFVAVVNSYKQKELDNQAMQLIAGRLDDEQIASLALYFATLPEVE